MLLNLKRVCLVDRKSSIIEGLIRTNKAPSKIYSLKKVFYKNGRGTGGVGKKTLTITPDALFEGAIFSSTNLIKLSIN